MSSKRISYSDATVLVNDFKSRARFCVTPKLCIRLKVIPVGSYRRGTDTLKDIDFLVVYPKKYAKYRDKILSGFKLNESKKPQIQTIAANPKVQGSTHSAYVAELSGRPDTNFVIDLFLIADESLPFALFHYTGSKTFNIRTRAYVKRMGLLLNQYGVFDAGKKLKTGIHSERDIFKYFDITY